MNSQQRFWDQLKDVFIGAEIKGDSGFVNLMRIKSAYFDVVFEELQKLVEMGTADWPEFREELFDKLYSFFKRYFSESGSIYFTYTPLKEQVYEKVYTNMDDVALFWKTHMLYYVKTGQLWRNLSVKVRDQEGSEWEVSFDVANIQQDQINERRRQLVFALDDYDVERKNLLLTVYYSTRGQKTKLGQIVKALKKEGILFGEEELERAIRIFLRQNEVDFFINKDAERFLKEQFDLWLKTYLIDEESIFDATRLTQLKFLKIIAYKVIEFIAKFEEELKKIWNKPKAVLKSNYVITFDRLLKFEGGWNVVERILKDEEIANQIEEWRELGLVDEKFNKEDLFVVNVEGERNFSDAWKFLCVDTKHFGENIKHELLSLVDNHDAQLDGWVIQGENYQVLKTLRHRLMSSIKLIYIDPPYNTGQDEFAYKDRFKNSSWLTMMNDRLLIAKDLLNEAGVIFVSIDDNEIHELHFLMDTIFGKSNRLADLIWNLGTGTTAGHFCRSHEYLLAYAKNKSVLPNFAGGTGKIRERAVKRISRANPASAITFPAGIEYEGDDAVFAGTIGGSETMTIEGEMIFKNGKLQNDVTITAGWAMRNQILRWLSGKETFDSKGQKVLRFYFNKNGILWYEKERATRNPKTILSNVGSTKDGSNELIALFDRQMIAFPKPTKLLKFVIELTMPDESSEGMVLDFFAGSGTTADALLKLNKQDKIGRKFLLIDVSDSVQKTIIPRLKKIAFSSKWKKGKPIGSDGQSLFFKYFKLEGYEDVLRKSIYRESYSLQYESLDIPDLYYTYLFLNDRKLLESVDIGSDNVTIDLRKVYPTIDVAETLANLKGKPIRRIKLGGVEFLDGEYVSFDALKFSDIRELIWW